MKPGAPPSLTRLLSARLLGFGLALGALGGCAALEAPVARSVDGVVSEGRFIEPEAYALYAVAALHEARGQLAEALELYQAALRIDSRGPEIRTRIAAVACRLRQPRFARVADRAFAEALEQAPEHGPLWFELARCRRARGQLRKALAAAYEALALDPERYEASLLAADLAELSGDVATAWRLRDALATHAPRSVEVQRALLSAATRRSDAPRRARAEAALAELRATGATRRAHSGVPAALAALAQGETKLARAEAERALAADPENGDALVVALFAADLEQDQAGFAALLETAAHAGSPASPTTLSLLEALVARRISASASQAIERARR